jgi:hypothetical protein
MGEILVEAIDQTDEGIPSAPYTVSASGAALSGMVAAPQKIKRQISYNLIHRTAYNSDAASMVKLDTWAKVSNYGR